MFQNATFYLIHRYSDNLYGQQAQQQCQIIPAPSDDVNKRSCNILENRLTDLWPRNQWDIRVSFSGFNLPGKSYHISEPQQQSQALRPNSVVVSGEVLNKLHSLMLYNTENARLKIKLSADLAFQANLGTNPPESLLTTVTYESGKEKAINRGVATMALDGTLFQGREGAGKGPGKGKEKRNIKVWNGELLPQLLNGRSDHGRYCSTQKGPATSVMSSRNQHIGFKLCNLNVWIEGIEFDLDYISKSNGMEGQRRLLESGLCSDVEIIAKDNLRIRSHELVLIAQSPVLETMLTGSNFVESKTRQIPMEDHAKEDVMAFLTFLYCGDIRPTLSDTSLGVTLYEMAHYYDVKGLESAIKTVLVSRPTDSFEVDTAIQLFNMTCATGDMELKQKAADVLEIKTHDEILSSELFKELSAPVIRELFVMSRRMF